MESIKEEEPVQTEQNLQLALLSILTQKLQENNIEINTSTIPDIVRYGMEIVEIASVEKSERKALVIELVKNIINESNLEESQKLASLHILESQLLENLIELLIKATKGELEFNQQTVEEVIEVTEDCCFAFLKFFNKPTNADNNAV